MCRGPGANSRHCRPTWLARPDVVASQFPRDAAAGTAARSSLSAEELADAAEEALGGRTLVAGLGRPELFEQFLLLGTHPRRRLDQESRDEIAAAAAVEHGHPRAAVAQLLARLDARRDFDVDQLTVDAGQADRPAKCRRGEADRAFGNQGRALAHVDR